MKTRESKLILVIIILLSLLIGMSINSIINSKITLINGKQIIKEMTQSENEVNLQTQINNLNTEHTEYMNHIEESKKKIAEAITKKGITTSYEETLETMANNIQSIDISSIDLSKLECIKYWNYGNSANGRFTKYTCDKDGTYIVIGLAGNYGGTNIYVNDVQHSSNAVTIDSGNGFYTSGTSSYNLGTFHITIAQIDAKIGDIIYPAQVHSYTGLTVLLREK